MTITIRPAAPQDADTVHALGEHVEEFKTSKETVTFWPKHILQTAIESDDAIVLVAEQDGSVVGFIIGNCNRALSKALIEASGDRSVFLCGATANDADELWDLFDCVFARTLDETTLKHRIQTRTTNDFGKNQHEFQTLLGWQRTAAEDYEKLGARLVDATRPLNEVVDEIVKTAERNAHV